MGAAPTRSTFPRVPARPHAAPRDCSVKRELALRFVGQSYSLPVRLPAGRLSRTQLVLCVHPSSPFKSAQELVAFAKANPGKLTFASAGIGTGIHLAAEQFRQVTGIEIVIVRS